MNACTAVPLGYGFVPSVMSVATVRPLGSTAFGSRVKLLPVSLQMSGVVAHGFAAPCSAAPARATRPEPLSA